PLLGFFNVKGMNSTEVQPALAKALAEKVFQGPRVQVSLMKQAQSDKVYVFGGVKTPGMLQIRDSVSLMDAVQMAGGFEDGNLYGNNQWLTNPTDPRSNMAGFQVTATFDYLSDTKLKRGGKETKIDLKKLIMDGDVAQNIALQPNDVLLIPRRTAVALKDDETLYILGAVEFPARYRFRDNMSIMDAITMAGGLTNKHHIKFASIIRGIKKDADPKSVKPEVLKIDLRRFYYRGDISSDVALKPGDIVLVSTREYRNFLSQLGKFVDNFVPILGRADTVVGFDDTIRRFNDRFIK
ncbi:MAG TPA: SLBB domain-containing protein, partial [Candidatus Ozemobacteraceae bacterium]|nr:SLBB domain-containing protein [Candidatus Ozemobacteraceae bacterium]